MNGHRSLSSILDRWRDAERRLESARNSGQVEIVPVLEQEVAGFAAEYQARVTAALYQQGETTVGAGGLAQAR